MRLCWASKEHLRTSSRITTGNWACHVINRLLSWWLMHLNIAALQGPINILPFLAPCCCAAASVPGLRECCKISTVIVCCYNGNFSPHLLQPPTHTATASTLQLPWQHQPPQSAIESMLQCHSNDIRLPGLRPNITLFTHAVAPNRHSVSQFHKITIATSAKDITPCHAATVPTLWPWQFHPHTERKGNHETKFPSFSSFLISACFLGCSLILYLTISSPKREKQDPGPRASSRSGRTNVFPWNPSPSLQGLPLAKKKKYCTCGSTCSTWLVQ